MSVALRTITRLQDADDINVSLGVGVDEYALVYDHDTAKFVLRAMSAGVTDHGALTGLADDDHTQYLLATGARTGASSQAQTFTNGIIGPSWKPANDSETALKMTNAAGTAVVTVDTSNKRLSLPYGIVYSGSTPMVQFDAAKSNVWLGNAGSATASGSNNTGFGDAALAGVTSGSNNFGAGYCSLFSIAGGSNNFALGLMSMAYAANTGGCVSIGNYSGLNATGGNSIFIGYMAGRYETASQRLHIDSLDRTNEATGRISSLLYGEIDSTVANQLLRANGVLQSLMNDSATNAATTQVKISHNTSGIVANGFGSRVLWELKSSTTADQAAAALDVIWATATHDSRAGRALLYAYDTAARECLRIEASGSAPMIGFLGASAAARRSHVADPSGGSTVDAEARSAINSILATLEIFGFHATS